MKQLEEKIRKEGKILSGDILKVDNFLNHQIDVAFLNEIGEEFHRLFAGEAVTKIMTIEASGIALAVAASQAFGNVPVVFAKKVLARNMGEGRYSEACYSYTRQIPYHVSVSKEYLSEEDHVLIIDDFLANGEAANAMISICRQAKATIAGVGIVIEKTYQPGRERIEKLGVKIHSLARIRFMDEENIEFIEEE